MNDVATTGCPVLCAFLQRVGIPTVETGDLDCFPAGRGEFYFEHGPKSQSPESHSGLEMGTNRRLHV